MAIEVHEGALKDLPGVAQLCLLAREESATPSQICSPEPERIKAQLGVLLSVEGGRIYVATDGERMVGFGLARVIEVNVYNDEPVMYVEALYVDQSVRRRGVGHALLTAIAKAAVEAKAVEVFSVPIPGSRGVQRFLARMGFAPAAAHRVVPTAVLLRKLEVEGSGTRRGTSALEDLIARRRKARIETQSGPVDLRTLKVRLAADQAQADDVAAAAVVAQAAVTQAADRAARALRADQRDGHRTTQ